MRRVFLASLVVLGCTSDQFLGLDGSADGGADGGDGCASGSTCPANGSCANFDDGTLGAFKNVSNNTNDVAVVSTPFVTCPSSALAKLSPWAAGAHSLITANKVLALSASTSVVHLEMDVMLPPPIAAGIFSVYVNDAKDSIGLGSDGGTWGLFVNSTGASANLVSPRINAWNHMVMDVIYSTNNSLGKATLSYQDTTGNTVTAKITNEATLSGSTGLIVSIGTVIGLDPTTSSGAGASVYFDDIVFTAQ